MIRFTVFIPSLFLSGNIPDIDIATDHETVDFRLTVYGAVLLEGRYYAFDGYATVSDIAPLNEHYSAGALPTMPKRNLACITSAGSSEGVICIKREIF